MCSCLFLHPYNWQKVITGCITKSWLNSNSTFLWHLFIFSSHWRRSAASRSYYWGNKLLRQFEIPAQAPVSSANILTHYHTGVLMFEKCRMNLTEHFTKATCRSFRPFYSVKHEYAFSDCTPQLALKKGHSLIGYNHLFMRLSFCYWFCVQFPVLLLQLSWREKWWRCHVMKWWNHRRRRRGAGVLAPQSKMGCAAVC